MEADKYKMNLHSIFFYTALSVTGSEIPWFGLENKTKTSLTWTDGTPYDYEAEWDNAHKGNYPYGMVSINDRNIFLAIRTFRYKF